MAISDYRFENLPRSAQISIFTGVLLCLTFVFYLYFMKDLIKRRDGLQADIVKLERSVAQGTAIESQLKRFKQELAQLEERLAVLQSILPAQKETPAVLRSVQQMAAASNLKINRFTPQPVVPRAFYSDWPIQIEVEGNYDGLGAFFEKVSQATRIIDVGAITINGDKEQAADRSNTLTATCTATTFVFREEEAVPSTEKENRKESKKENKKEKKKEKKQ
jgi:type IV pilus assembly protein PilO